VVIGRPSAASAPLPPRPARLSAAWPLLVASAVAGRLSPSGPLLPPGAGLGPALLVPSSPLLLLLWVGAVARRPPLPSAALLGPPAAAGAATGAKGVPRPPRLLLVAAGSGGARLGALGGRAATPGGCCCCCCCCCCGGFRAGGGAPGLASLQDSNKCSRCEMSCRINCEKSDGSCKASRVILPVQRQEVTGAQHRPEYMLLYA
jgi:hypothetical protein